MSRGGARMPSIGAGSVDIRSIFSSILNVIKSRANQICSATCDGLVLRMHYRWTFCLLLGGFLTVWYSWYHRDVITCVSHFNAETQVRLDYINICLSYPYLEEEENGPRRYILFYRWISWSLLVLAGVFYIPRKISKSLDNARCKKLLEDLASNASRYDQVEEQLVERAARYLIFNLKTHNGLYWKYLGVNVLALGVDLFAMQYLDFILQGRFIGYGFNSYPFSRDPRTFTDYMSQTFPPFATCELTRVNQLTNKRTEKFGCHLTIMELYEKVFLVLWLWLILLTFLTCCYLVFLACMWLPCVRCYLLRTAKPAHGSDKVRNVIQKVAANCKIGDIYLLYRLKGHLSHVRFYELMMRLSDPSLRSAQPQPAPGPTPEGKDKMPPNKMQDTLRRRPAPQDQQMLPEYLQQYLNNPEMMQRHPQAPHPDQRTPLLKKATSILIE
ncbi:innexin inx2-like isoform X2 [Scylla paramamosain]|uniref:innexin inx2-like isoform X2 n=1 Tax=Scylla paramamosain TaxID=85552 RepID=UPI00308342E2